MSTKTDSKEVSGCNEYQCVVKKDYLKCTVACHIKEQIRESNAIWEKYFNPPKTKRKRKR